MKTTKNVRLKLLVFVSISLISGALMAQADTRTDQHDVSIVIPQVALLDLETASENKNITATFVDGGEAGNPLTAPAANTSLWLNYSSVLSSTVTSRSVNVAISSGTTPGFNVKVEAAAAASDGVGTLGTKTAAVTLSSTATPIITAIGSAYTLTGSGKGHQLTYSFETSNGSSNYALLRSGTSAITVTYTLVDN